ncbi:MAG TPA: hypothetical protein VK192_04750 [Sphingomicrobium sp.]|nr:hypothetical protein [Sphingomicrobium sp.]
MKRLSTTALVIAASGLAACSSLGAGEGYGFSDYSAVNVHRVKVGNGNMSVVPPRPWNRHRAILFEDVPAVEDWTLNGPLLDGITFITGLRSGHFMVRQRRSTDQQVPKFRADMTPPEIAAMLESLYRVRGGAVDFHTLSIQPRPFLGRNGFQLDYEHLDDDELWRKGRAIGTVVNGELYLVMFDAARSHYYDAALPDFEAIVASAELSA